MSGPLVRATRQMPEFPRTPHLPHRPNAGRGDLVASADEVGPALSARRLTVEEKVDGAAVAMTMLYGEPAVRSREHVLRKGYRARTPARRQFASLHNYAHAAADKLRELQRLVGAPASAYGEWLVMPHGTLYDRAFVKACPFVAHSVYDPELRDFVDPLVARELLQRCGFVVPELLAAEATSYERLAELAAGPSRWSSADPREGVYVKVGDGERTTARFKMVRPDFVPGRYFEER